MNRRNFIKKTIFNAAKMGAGSTLLSLMQRQMVFADSSSASNFSGANGINRGTHQSANLVVIRIHGGLDSIAGLNPWVKNLPPKSDLLVPYSPELPVIKNANGTKINLGPAASALAPYVKKMALIKGIWMGPSDLGHPFASHYMIAGRSQEKSPYISAIVSEAQKSSGAFLILNEPIEKGHLELKVLQTESLKNGLGLGDTRDQELVSLLPPTLNHITAYQSLLEKIDKVEIFNSIVNELKVENQVSDESIVIAALVSGLSSVAQIDMDLLTGGSVDNHIQYLENHVKNQKYRWDRVALFLGNLEKYKLLDNTLVIAITEFSRTASGNSNDGKDHNYSNNTMALFGYGIKGGSTIGDQELFLHPGQNTKPELSGSFIDFRSGEVALTRSKYHSESRIPSGIDLIRPSNCLETVLQIVAPELKNTFGQNIWPLNKIMA